MRSISFAGAVVFVLAFVLQAGADEVPTLEARAAKAFVFKNGISMAALEVELPTQAGVYRVAPLPEASLGGFWLAWPDGVTIENIKATMARRETDVEASTIPELIEANIGSDVDLGVDESWYSGRIVSVPKTGESAVPMEEGRVIPPPAPPSRGEVVILESDNDTTFAIPLHTVNKLRFRNQESETKRKKWVEENVIEFEVAEAGATGGVMQVQYLASGLSWSPSYVIDISDDERAQISAKAVLVNDLVPLEDVYAELVTGYPHLMFSDKSSHFSLKPLDQLVAQLERESQRRGRGAERMMMNQAVAYDAGFAMASMPQTPVSGESEEDLFFYSLKGVDLKQGERGYFPLFADGVPFEHLYTLNLPNALQNQSEPVVWHTLKLTNESDYPWTTAPAMTVKNGRILGQDMIEYTPVGARSDLKITQAVSVRAEHTESEIGRTPNAMQMSRMPPFDEVIIKGEVRVANYKDEAIRIEIVKTFEGELIEADGSPEKRKLAAGLQQVNPQTQLTWTQTVEPGADNALMLEYTYKLYARR